MPEFAKELARKNLEQVAIRDDNKALDWNDVDEILNRVTNRLLESDLGEQRRISVFAENSVETALAHLGGLLAGASTVPVNFHLTAEEAAYILKDSETSILFLGPETLDRGLEAAQIAKLIRSLCGVVKRANLRISKHGKNGTGPHCMKTQLQISGRYLICFTLLGLLAGQKELIFHQQCLQEAKQSKSISRPSKKVDLVSMETI